LLLSTGCAFEYAPPPPRAPPALLPRWSIEVQMAKDTAALLTAAAHGPLSAWCFVAPSDFGLGLWAREALYPHQALGEYAGPRLPLSMHQRGEYVLGIASRQKGPAWQGQRFRGLLFVVAWRTGAGAYKHLSLAARHPRHRRGHRRREREQPARA